MTELIRRTMRSLTSGLAALVLVMAFASACQRDATNSTPIRAANHVATRTVALPVDGMICQVCAGRVKSALKAVHGVQDAQINLERRNAVIQYEDGKVTTDQLTRAINDLGYKAGMPKALQ